MRQPAQAAMAEFIDETIRNLEKCFSGKAAFCWFTAFIPGPILAADCGGASSITRELGLNP
ncbi:MAG: hypothetical protein LBU32_16590 [Clostridiales bacterium]|nr:hypothetical protein [Clostridiales bacterium]